MVKRTSSQAMIASKDPQSRSRTAGKGRMLLLGFAALSALLVTFYLGRESVSMPSDFQSAVFELKLHILEQQGEIDRLGLDNRNNINALAARMAELQAASTRIDALGERLAQLGQLTLDEFDFTHEAPVGGPADPYNMQASTELELRTSVGVLSEKLRRQSSQLDALSYLMVNRQIENDMTPSGWPVRKGWISSRYGERTDPFTGERTNHDGLDFVGVRGSDVLSVASGVVVWAGKRRGYGNTIEIDHGNGYRTRYAHNESLEVEPGIQVSAGQLIAKLGSSGRASAPHVHFEVLLNGQQINPAKFVGQLR